MNTFSKISLVIVVIFIMILTIIHLYFWIQMIKLHGLHNQEKNASESIETNMSHFAGSDIPRSLMVSGGTESLLKPSQPIIQQPVIVPPPPPIDPVRSYDYRKLYDPLEDPTTRVDRYLLGPLEYRRMFNYPTQGYPDTYRWLGILICTDDDVPKNKIIKLFGRQKYPNSNDYQYYTMLNMDHDQIKVHIHRRKELYDDDIVNISELGKTYKVQLNKDDDMRYAF